MKWYSFSIVTTVRTHISDNHVQLDSRKPFCCGMLIAALILLICSPEAHTATWWCANQTNCSKACGALFEGKLQMVAPRKNQIWCKRGKDSEQGSWPQFEKPCSGVLCHFWFSAAPNHDSASNSLPPNRQHFLWWSDPTSIAHTPIRAGGHTRGRRICEKAFHNRRQN